MGNLYQYMMIIAGILTDHSGVRVASCVSAVPGTVVCSLLCSYALCSAAMSAIFRGPFGSEDLAGFLLFLGIFASSVAALSAGLIGNPPVHMGTEVGAEDAPKKRESDSLLTVLKAKIVSVTFWLIFMCFFVGIGAGLMHSNNLGQLTKALNGGNEAKDQTLLNVSLFSFASAGGRILMTASDLFNVRRGWWLSGSIGFMAVSHLLVPICLDENMFGLLSVVTICVGLAYGCIWSVISTMISEAFKPENFGQDWGWMNIAPAVGSLFFNKICGIMYDAVAAKQSQLKPVTGGHHHQCTGIDCFSGAYMFSCGMCLFGFLISLALIPRTKLGKTPDTPKAANPSPVPLKSVV
eukprot:707727_1